MSKPTVVPNEHELAIAKQGIEFQLEAHGVVMTPELQKFIDNQIQVIAQYMAWMRYLNKSVAES